MRHTPPRLSRPLSSAVAAATAVALSAAALTGCTNAAPVEPTRTATATPTPTAIATTTPTPTAPALVADGTAEDNLPLFTAVMQEIWAGDQRVQGRAYIDALAVAGFDKSQMEVTQDVTTVGNAADAIQFSVRWKGECLVGQVGPSTPAPAATVLPEVPGGTCLIGQTRPIDW